MRHPGLIILAAGSSSRMGEPKQLLPWGESTLLRHACVTALAVRCAPVVLVLGCHAERCRESCADLPLLVVENPEWAQGLGSSLATGVTALLAADPESVGVLVMLADQPAVSSALLETLLGHWDPVAQPIAAMTYHGNGGVPAIFARSYFPELQTLREDRGARQLIAREKFRAALIDGGNQLIDLDTPAAYREHQPKPVDADWVPAGNFMD